MTEASDTRLVLCLMVRNEERIIERCLRAALPHVDACVLSVNNTTDRTVEIAERVAGEMGVPMHVTTSAWRNFGANRTRSVLDTRAWAEAAGWQLDRTYAVLIDADHVLHARGAFAREALTEPCYELDTNDGRLRNPGTRLIRLAHEWSSVGVTHEYWASAPNSFPVFYPDLWVEDRCDGGSKSDKLTRDVRLLTEGLRDEPENSRYMFYLAESHFHLGQWKKAVRWYEKRMAAGGWDEEVWYSRYKRGRALLQQNHETGAGALLEAFSARPSRVEPLATLAAHYRVRGQNQLAYMLARHGEQISVSPDRLFVELDAQARCREEIAISGYYCGPEAREHGFAACERLLAVRDKDESYYRHWSNNESFYLQPAASKRRGAFWLPPEMLHHEGLPYRGTNPTILDAADGVGGQFVHVRLVNFEHHGGRNYRAFDPRGVFRTRGALFRWDADSGTPTSVTHEVTQHLPPEWPVDVLITGLEDQRWIRHNGRVWFTATCCQVPGAGGQPRVVLGRMNEALNAVERVIQLHYGGNIEKNWAPWSYNGELLLIYSYDPFIVLKVDPATGACTERVRWTPPQRFARWRGSTSPVCVVESACWLLLVHEVAYREHENIYAHRWVALDPTTMEICGHSRPFVFDHVGVEYAAGLHLREDCSGAGHLGSLIVTYGTEDREPRWIEYDLEETLNLLTWTDDRMNADHGEKNK